MSEKKDSRPFWRRHIFGWVLSACSVVVGSVLYFVWGVYYGPIGAGIAAKQVEDSAAAFALHQAVNYGNIVPVLIVLGTMFFALLFLVPTIKDSMGMGQQ